MPKRIYKLALLAESYCDFCAKAKETDLGDERFYKQLLFHTLDDIFVSGSKKDCRRVRRTKVHCYERRYDKAAQIIRAIIVNHELSLSNLWVGLKDRPTHRK